MKENKPRLKPRLKLTWATHESAKYACEHWHYSKRVPVNKLVKIGVWEDEYFVGVLVFGLGASPRASLQYDLEPMELCELVRVALRSHSHPVSRMVAIALKLLKQKNPGLRLCVSFADPVQGHHGGIYQAGNWLYLGKSRPQVEVFHKGVWTHMRSVYNRIPADQLQLLATRPISGKYKYVMPFDSQMKEKLEAKALPYPKHAPKAEASMRLSSTQEKDGLSPISALQKVKSSNEKVRKRIL